MADEVPRVEPASDDQELRDAIAAMGMEQVDGGDLPADRKPKKKRKKKTIVEPEPPTPGTDLAVIDEVAPLEEELIDPEIVVPEVEDRAYKAHMLRLQGNSWEVVADRADYASGSGAAAAVQTWLQRGALADGLEIAAQRARMALERTEQTIAAFWDKMVAGDADAAKIVLKANADYFRMAGLERALTTITSKQTIVISGGPDMAAQLQAAAEQADEERRRAQDDGVVTVVGED